MEKNNLKLDKILTLVKAYVVPSKKETRGLLKISRIIKKLLFSKLVKKGLELEIKLAGSLAKNTRLKGHYQFDLFIILDPITDLFYFHQINLEISSEIFDSCQSMLIDHPYVRGLLTDKNSLKTISVDLVPCYSLRDDSSFLKTAVDMTPLSTIYVNKHLKNNLDVLLLKTFCNGLGLYGAGSLIRGFSGYCCEVMIIKYGSLVNLFLNIDELFSQNLKLEDPLKRTRNLFSSLSIDNLFRFKYLVKQFLKKPSIEYFLPDFRTLSVLEKRHLIRYLSKVDLWLLVYKTTTTNAKNNDLEKEYFEKLRDINNNLIPTLKYNERYLNHRILPLREYFNLFKDDRLLQEVDQNQDLLMVILELRRAKQTIIVKQGPPVNLEQHPENYINLVKNRLLFINNGRLWSRELLKETDLDSEFKKYRLKIKINDRLEEGEKILKYYFYYF